MRGLFHLSDRELRTMLQAIERELDVLEAREDRIPDSVLEELEDRFSAIERIIDERRDSHRRTREGIANAERRYLSQAVNSFQH